MQTVSSVDEDTLKVLIKYLKHTFYCGWNHKDGYYDKTLGCTCGLDEIMGLKDKVLIRYNFKRNSYYLVRGNETFYDEEDIMREWDDEQGARKWAVANLGVDPRFDPREQRQAKAEKKVKENDKQPTLF